MKIIINDKIIDMNNEIAEKINEIKLNPSKLKKQKEYEFFVELFGLEKVYLSKLVKFSSFAVQFHT